VRSGWIADIGAASLIVITMAVLMPLILERLVRGTPFDFLFVRPRRFRLATASGRSVPALQPG
jgi:hypothetical protein